MEHLIMIVFIMLIAIFILIIGLKLTNAIYNSNPKYVYFIHYKLRNEDTWMLWPGVYETKQLAIEAVAHAEDRFKQYNFLVVKDCIK